MTSSLRNSVHHSLQAQRGELVSQMFVPIQLQEAAFWSEITKQSSRLATEDYIQVYCKQ